MKIFKLNAYLFGTLIFLSLSVHGIANAKPAGGFSGGELKAILPLLRKHGVVALAETEDNGNPKAMTLAVRVNAPRRFAFKVFENPENFYYVSTLFKENKVLQEHQNTKAYSWASRHKWFSFVGTNTVSLFPPRRVDVSIVKSTVGSGDFRVLFYEDGPDHSIVVLSGLLDVKSSEWLIRYLVGVNPAMRLAMNMAIGLVVVKGIKALAEQDAKGKPLAKHRTRGSREGELRALPKKEIDLLKPLLDRGAIVITNSVPKGKLGQATVIERVNAPSARFLVAVATPELYPKMVRAISDIQIHQKSEQATDFSWTLGFSIFNLSSRNRLTYAPDGVIVEGMEGDLGGALWRWQVMDDGPAGCIVAYHGWANMKTAGYILDKSVKREPYLEHGFMAGSNMVMLRAVKRVVEKK